MLMFLCSFLSMDEMSFNAPVQSQVNTDLLNQILLNNLDIDEEEEEDDPDETEEAEERSKQIEENRKKLDASFHLSIPPGINLFRSKKSPTENSFRYFTLETLSLETDFGYSRRPELLEHGFSEDTINEIFTDRFEFVRHLFPEAQSVLICDQADFKSVMNFLYYSVSVCTDRR